MTAKPWMTAMTGKNGLKYCALADELRRLIAEGILGPGEKFPPEPDLAKQHKVGRITVRNALKLLEGEGLLTREKGRGTFVAGTTFDTLGRKILYVGEMESHFYRDLYIHLLEQTQAAGDDLTGYATPTGEPADLSRPGLQSRLRVATQLICNANVWPQIAPIVPDTVRGVAVVGIFAPREAREVPAFYVQGDRAEAACLAGTHLLNRGHRRIAYVGPNYDARTTLKPCAAATTRCMVNAEAPFRENGIIPMASIGQWGSSPEERRESSCSSLARLKTWPTAFIVEADYRTIDFLRAAADLDRQCPRDFSVISIGDTPWAEACTPPVTSVSFGEQEMAELAALLCRRPRPGRVIRFAVQPHLVERESVRPLEDTSA